MPLCDDNPQPLGVASPGVSNKASRCDHVHPVFTSAKVSRSTNQSIPNGVSTPISFDTEEFDNGNYWDSGDPTKLIIAEDGFYLFVASGSFASNTTGTRTFNIVSNDIGTIAVETVEALAAGNVRRAVPAMARLSAGDFVIFTVTQTSGGPLNSLPPLNFAVQKLA